MAGQGLSAVDAGAVLVKSSKGRYCLVSAEDAKALCANAADAAIRRLSRKSNPTSWEIVKEGTTEHKEGLIKATGADYEL